MNRAKAHRLERGEEPADLDVFGDDVTMDSDEGSNPFPPTKGRGRGGSRGRGGRGRGRGASSMSMSTTVHGH